MHSYRYIFLMLLASMIILIPGYSSAQLNSNRALMERLDRMEKNMNVMQRQLARDDGLDYSEPTDADRKPIMSGGIAGNLEEELRRLRGELETSQYEIERLKNRIKLLEEDVDFRFRSIESGGPATPKTTGSNIQPKAPPPVDTAASDLLVDDSAFHPDNGYKAPDSSGKLAKPGTYVADEPRGHYNRAFRLLNQNRYDDAEKAFADFTTKFPDDPLIGNAYYWLGETHYIRKNYIEAADNFRAGYQKLPDGPKAPDNLLKLAITLKTLDRTQDACTVIEQIDKKFKDASSNLLQRAASEKKLMGC